MAESTSTGSTAGKDNPDAITKAKNAEAQKKQDAERKASASRAMSSSADKETEETRKKVEADLAEHERVQRKTAEDAVNRQGGAEDQMQDSDKATREQREKNIEALKAVQTPQEPVYFDPMNPEELADPANLPAETDDVDERERIRTTSS
jgi:hypothetical protein